MYLAGGLIDGLGYLTTLFNCRRYVTSNGVMIVNGEIEIM
jgi:hypothetical protein